MSNTAEQIDSRIIRGAGGLSFINIIDIHLRVVAQLQLATKVHHSIRLRLSLYYDNESCGLLTFDLHHYSPAEGVALARNIGANQFIMREIDEYLCADMIE